MKYLYSIAIILISLNSFADNYPHKGFDAYEKRDFVTAYREFIPYAENGHLFTQYTIGYMYVHGHGVIQDYVYAHMWWNIAASKGDKSSREGIKKLEKNMTPSQIAEAQKLARECVKKNYKDC